VDPDPHQNVKGIPNTGVNNVNILTEINWWLRSVRVSLWQLIRWNRLLVFFPLFQQPLQIGVTAYDKLNNYSSSLVAYERELKTEAFAKRALVVYLRKESKDVGFREARAFITYFIGIVGFAITQDNLAFGILSKIAEQPTGTDR
jgi:hypothetical protein